MAKTIRDGFYQYLADMKKADKHYQFNLNQLKLWADAAFAEADVQSTYLNKAVIDFVKDMADNYDHEDGQGSTHCRQCKAEELLNLLGIDHG